jgi:hypothetical protein
MMMNQSGAEENGGGRRDRRWNSARGTAPFRSIIPDTGRRIDPACSRRCHLRSISRLMSIGRRGSRVISSIRGESATLSPGHATNMGTTDAVGQPFFGCRAIPLGQYPHLRVVGNVEPIPFRLRGSRAMALMPTPASAGSGAKIDLAVSRLRQKLSPGPGSLYRDVSAAPDSRAKSSSTAAISFCRRGSCAAGVAANSVSR